MIHISPSLVGSVAELLGRCTAVIGWQDVVRSSTVTATSEASAWPAAAVQNPMTYERWKPQSAPATLTIEFDGSTSVDYIGIAAHTLGSEGATCVIEYKEGASWVELIQVAPHDDSAQMVLLAEVLTTAIRLRIDKVAEIGVVYAGRALMMQRQMYGGHSPGTLSRQTTIKPNISNTGQFLGRSVVRRGLVTTFDWEHLTAAWYRAKFDPFVESAAKYPFFIAWNVKKFPNEVMYAWTQDDIQPVNMGIRDYMQVTMGVEALA